MVRNDLRGTTCELGVTSYDFKAQKHELRFKSASSNPRVASSSSWAPESFNQ